MSAVNELADAVGLAAGSLDELDGLGDERLASLTALASAAVEHEDILVQESLEAALAALPRPLRGRARALLLEES